VELTQSKVGGGNIESASDTRSFPSTAGNWLDLSLLAPGSRVNAVSCPCPRGGVTHGGRPRPPGQAGNHGGVFSSTVDGQQVTNQLACTSWGQFKFSNDSIQEFEMVTSRFDATQGRSTQLQVNAVTKAGTNRLSGTAAGYFRSDKGSIPRTSSPTRCCRLSDQQGSVTLGGPIVKDRLHFFGYWGRRAKPQQLYLYERLSCLQQRRRGFRGSNRRTTSGGGRGDYSSTAARI